MSQIKRIKLIIIALFVIGGGVALVTDSALNRRARAFSSGPPPGRTGAPAEDTCAECHLPEGLQSNGALTITAPSTYVPGQTYQITVQHSTTDQTRLRWGFELTVLDGGDQKAGTLQTNNDGLTRLRSNEEPHPDRQYIEHTASGTFASQHNGASWTFQWTAPAQNIGPVTFYAAGNQANNNANSSGDIIYTTFKQVLPATDYTFSVTPTARTVAPGGTAVYDLVVTPSGGFTGLVSFSLGVLPAGVSANFNPAVVNLTDAAPRNATLTISTMTAAAPGLLTLIPSASSGVLSRSAQVTLTITNTPGPAVQFSAASFSASEGSGHATITVTRTGDTTGTVAVDYTTVDDPAAVRCDDTTTKPGVAFARCDYATTIDTLTFAPGETSKTFDVPLIDDAFVEGAETVTLRLTNPVAATLGTQSTATLTITDNDATAGANPIFTTPFFVRMQYLDFLAREPEAGEPWSGVLNRCPDVNNLDPNSASAGCDRINVSASFFGSPEFRIKGYFVLLFYKVSFARLPQYAEFIPDLRSVTGQTAPEVYAKKAAFTDAFAGRPEFRNLYDRLSNTEFVDALMSHYNLQSITTIDPANPDGATTVTLTRADLTNRLNAQTLTRPQVLRALVQSREVDTVEFNGAFVAMQYYGYLRRTPDVSGYNSWLNYLTTHPTDFRTMVNGFMNSIEYRLRFGRAS